MLSKFVETKRDKSELATALAVIREFKGNEDADEWAMHPFITWQKLEQLENYLSHIVEGTKLEDE